MSDYLHSLQSGIQNGLIKQLQESGCYFLSIIHIAEKNNVSPTVDVLRFASECIERKWLQKDFTVLQPGLILGKLLGKTVTVIELKASDYQPELIMSANAIVNCWFNKRTGFYHFNCNDWDSLSNSVTVKEGKIVSYRVFSW